MKRILIISLVIAALCGVRPVLADTEWVLMLDNSTSMRLPTDIWDKKPGATEWTKTGRQSPANDPDRLAVLATLVFRGLAGSEDKLTILTFNSFKAGANGQLVKTPGQFTKLDTIGDVRTVQFNQMTYMEGPLTEARRILETSTATTKILLLATDGGPGPEKSDNLDDALTGTTGRALLGLDPGPPKFEVVSLALAKEADGIAIQNSFLGALGRVYPLEDPKKLVAAFTEVFAQSIRSRPEIGTLPPGKSYDFRVGKYVSDVYVVIATEAKTGPFTAKLTADGSSLVPLDGGDNGCTPPPCHAYQVFKTKHDPKKDSQFSLSVPASAGQVAYGIIMKYELGAEIVSGPSKAKSGEQVDVVARIVWQGATFNDAAFFKADGFKAELWLDNESVPLTLKDDGTFTAKLPVTGAPRTGKLEARFSNQWIKLGGGRDLVIEEWLPLALKVGAIDFGSWTGGRKETRRCIDIDLAGSTNADKVPLEAIAAGLKDGYALSVPKPLVVKAGKFAACLVAPGCCAPSPKDATITIRGVDPHYLPDALQAPMKVAVAPTPFLTCWWLYIATGIGTLIFIIILIGIIKPKDFSKEDMIKLAKTESALDRAGGRRLRELPGGKRGFYRDARVAFDGAGNAVRATKGVNMILRAAKGDPQVLIFGGIEEKDPRTRKFVQVDLSKGPIYLRRGIVYKTGEFVFRVG